MAIFGTDDKAKSGCGRYVAISATSHQPIRTIVVEGQALIASLHDFDKDNLIPSVTHHMNIKSDARYSVYGGSEEGGGCVYVCVHNTTFEPSTGIKHATNLLRVMRTSIGTNESSRPFYLVGLDTDGGGDHNHKHVQNQLALFDLVLLGNMDKLNMTRGYPVISLSRLY